MTTKSEINPQKGAFGHHVLRVLGHDMSFSQQDANEKTLAGVLDKFAVKDKAGVVDWEKTAKNLVDSLNHLVPDDVEVTEVDGKKVETVVQVNDLSVDAQAEIVAWFKELSAEAKTPQEMAVKIAETDFLPDKDKKQSMFEFLILHGNAAGGYDYQTNGQMFNMLIAMISSFSPELGHVFSGLVKGMGIISARPEDAQAHNSLELAWEVAIYGREQDIAELSGYDIDDDSIRYNNFKGPSGSSEYKDFINGTGRFSHEFDLGYGTKPFATQSFKDLVFQPLLDKGVVKITDKSVDADGQSIVEKQAIQLAAQLLYGGQMGEKFSAALIDSKMLQFDGMSDADIAKFKAEFTQHLKDIDMSRPDSSWKAGKSILEFVEGHEGVSFNDAVTRQDMLDLIDPYSKSTGPEDFAARYQKYANNIPGLHVGFDGAQPELVSNGVSEIDEKPAVEPQAASAEETLKAASAQVHVKHEAVPSGNDGVVTKNANGDLAIGGHPPKEKFNDCATGKFTTPCLPDGPQSTEQYVANGAGVPQQEEPSNFVMQSSVNNAPAV